VFCQCNEAIQDVSAEQSCTQLDVTIPQEPSPVSSPSPASDPVIHSDSGGGPTVGIQNQGQGREADCLFVGTSSSSPEDKRHSVDSFFDQYSSDAHSSCFNSHGSFTYGPSHSTDAVIHGHQGPVKFLSNRNHVQVCGTDSLFGPVSNPDISVPKRPSPPDRMDHGMTTSAFESSSNNCSTCHLEIYGSEQCLSSETRVGGMDDESFLDQNELDAHLKSFNDLENVSDFGLLRDQFIRLENQGNERCVSSGTRVMDSFFDRNRSDKRARCSKDNGNRSDFESLRDRCMSPEDQANGLSLSKRHPIGETNCFSEQCDPEVSYKIPCRTISSSSQVNFVREKSPETSFLGLGIGVEPVEKPLLNFDKDEWVQKSRTKPVPEKLWPDDEPPEPPKRFRISFPNIERSSSSGSSGFQVENTEQPVSAGPDFVVPGSNVFSGGSFSERNYPVSRINVLKENTSEGCSQSDVCDPRMFNNHQLSVYSSKAVSLMQSEEGLHVITEETVAHTVVDNVPGADIQNAAQNHHAIGCHNTGKQMDHAKYAGLSENQSTGSDNRKPDNRIQEIILSPRSDTGTVVCQAPTRSLCSVGGTDRVDIVGGWKPLCGQTVVRKPSRTAQNTMQINPATGTRKVAKLSSDSLWTTFDGAAQKSEICAEQVSGWNRPGIAKNDGKAHSLAESVTLLATRGAGVNNKTGHVTSDLLERSPPDIAVPMNRAGISDIRPNVAKPGSTGERLELHTNRNGSEYQHKSINPVKNLVNLPQGAPLMRLELEASKAGRPFGGSSSANRKESTTVQKQQITSSTVDGCSDDVELASGNNSTFLNRFDAVGLSSNYCRSKSSFGERFWVDSTEKKNNMSLDGDKDQCFYDAVSKWQKFQESDSTDQRGHFTGSSLVRTTGNGSFQVGSSYLVWPAISSAPVHILSPDPVQHCEPSTRTSSSDVVGTKTATPSLIQATTGQNPFQRTTTGQSPFQSKVQSCWPPPARKPEVACVTPQVRQPLQALSLDQDTSTISQTEPGMSLFCLTCFVSPYVSK